MIRQLITGYMFIGYKNGIFVLYIVLLSELSQAELSQAFVGTIVNGLSLSTLQRQMHSCTVRPTSQNDRTPEAGKGAYLILTSGEWIPVLVTGIGMIRPTPEAVRSGAWQALDSLVYLRASDVTQEQAAQAQTFVQPSSSSQ